MHTIQRYLLRKELSEQFKNLIVEDTMDHIKRRLRTKEIARVIDWLMEDPLLKECSNGSVTKHGTRYRLMNNYNYYYVAGLDCMVQLDERTRDQVQKGVRARIDEIYSA